MLNKNEKIAHLHGADYIITCEYLEYLFVSLGMLKRARSFFLKLS